MQTVNYNQNFEDIEKLYHQEKKKNVNLQIKINEIYDMVEKTMLENDEEFEKLKNEKEQAIL